MACGKQDLTCGKKQPATCVKYEGELPEYSELDTCATIQETTEELYQLVTGIREDLDLTEIDFGCLTEPQEVNQKTVIQLLIDKICSQDTLLSTQAGQIETLQQQVQDLIDNQCPQ